MHRKLGTMNCNQCGKLLLGDEEVCSECRLRGQTSGAGTENGSEGPPVDERSADDLTQPEEGEAPRGTPLGPFLAILFFALAVFAFVASAYLVRSTQQTVMVVPTPRPFLSHTPLIETQPPLPTGSLVPPTPMPVTMRAAVGGVERELRGAVALMSADFRCLELALLPDSSPRADYERLSSEGTVTRAQLPESSLFIRINFKAPTRLCATKEIQSYVMLYPPEPAGFPLPAGQDRIELFRSNTWGGEREMVVLECDLFDEKTVRGAFRSTANSGGVAVSWDLAFWAPVIQSQQKFCGRAVPE